MNLSKLEAWLIGGVVLLLLGIIVIAVWHHDVTQEQKAKDTAATAAVVLQQVQDNYADAERRRGINEGIIHDLQARLAVAAVGTSVVVSGLCRAAAGPSPLPTTPGGASGANGPTPVAGIGETLADQYVAACRRDATRLAKWQDWAVKQGLPVE